MYCNEHGCDCRRVFFTVVSQALGKTVAILSWGWEDEDFYAKWLKDGDAQNTRHLKGPSVEPPFAPRTELANQFLKMADELLLSDPNYVERIKRHYRMFRERIEIGGAASKPGSPRLDEQAQEDRSLGAGMSTTQPIRKPSIGRNSPCPCGSGRKYKKCCLAKDEAASQSRNAELQLSRTPVEDGPEGRPRPQFSPDRVPPSARDETPSDDESGEHTSADDWVSASDLDGLTDEQAALVKSWWQEFAPIYEERDADAMTSRIDEFLEQHPELFGRLRLDEEVIFEVGGALQAAGQHGRYLELLQRLRRDQPEMYGRVHGWLDRDLVVELLVAGRRSEVAGCFGYFRKSPGEAPDELCAVVDVLLATNCETELFALAQDLAVPVYEAPDVVGGDFILDWLIHAQLVPALDRRDSSDEEIGNVLDRLEQLDLPVEVSATWVADELRDTLDRSVPKPPSSKKDFDRYLPRLIRHFTGWLHDRQGLTWSSAKFFALRLGEYVGGGRSGRKSGGTLSFKQAQLDSYIAQHCKKFFCLDGLAAMSLLQAVWWYAEFASENAVPSGDDAATIRGTAQRLAQLVREAAGKEDEGPLLLANLSCYRWTGSAATA
ncbi:MAG: SEC-C domain-containing protein [Candidatus Wallbacteria bacterium]|nr:SEC-C domain-containing protein [Candidatus Wallbacteria bacterium]